MERLAAVSSQVESRKSKSKIEKVFSLDLRLSTFDSRMLGL